MIIFKILANLRINLRFLANFIKNLVLQNQGVGECYHFLRLFDYAITCNKDAARE